MLDLDFVLESDVRAVVAGVPVRGVEMVEPNEGGAGFVGDFVGDYGSHTALADHIRHEAHLETHTLMDNLEPAPIILCLFLAASVAMPLEARDRVEAPTVASLDLRAATGCLTTLAVDSLRTKMP
jgi:hypothetical protein